MDVIQAFDWDIIYFVQDFLKCGFLDAVMPVITALCDGGIFWIICGVALLFFRKYRKYGVVLLLTMLLGSLIGNELIKPLVERARPCHLDATVPLLIDRPESFSFPSGHTVSSVISATVLTRADRRFGYAAIPLAVLIAFSRIYLFVHFPTDVLAGALLGFVLGFFMTTLARKLFDKYKVPYFD